MLLVGVAALAAACTASPAERPASPTPTGPSTETFEIGGYPNGIAYSHGSLWIGDPEASELLRVDPVTGDVVERISAGEGSFLVEASGGDLWVSDHIAGTVSRFDPSDGRLLDEVRVGEFPTTVVDAGSALYAVAGANPTLHRIDHRTNRAEPVIRFGDELEGLAFTPGSIWLTAYGDDRLQRFDGRTGEPRGSIDLDRSAWIMATAGNGRLWVTNRDEGTVTAVDPDGGIVATVDLPEGASPFGIESLGDHVWVTDADQGLLYELDPSTATVVAVHELPSPAFAMTIAGGDLWITAGDTGSLVRLEAPPVEPWAFEGEGKSLEPGRYAFDEFEPPLSFEVGPGWLGGHSHGEFFDVQREEGVLLGFGRPRVVFGAEGEVDVGGLGAEDALRTIATIDALDADPVSPTSIDGRRAFELRFRTDASTPLFGGDDGTFAIEPGGQRLLAVEVDGTLVLVVDDVWAEPRERLDALVQGVIDSIRFDPAPA
jgi:streptogramin lyase